MKQFIVFLLCGIVTFASAIGLVLYRHESRKLFVELQDLRKVRREIDQEWGQLLLEQATWATHVRVEEVARAELGMVSPSPQQIIELPQQPVELPRHVANAP